MQNHESTIDYQLAIQEAGRCLLCYDAPCDVDCGASTHPSEFIFKLRMDNIKGAIRTMRRNNILAATCALVCPTCRLCESGCSRTELDEPIRINEIQAFLANYERQIGMQVLRAPKPGDRRIAVVGSGPAGLSAAASLAMKGYAVVVFEKQPKPGGILRYGIPNHRLLSDLVDHEIDLISKLGVMFECNNAIDTRENLHKLLTQGYDAVFIATGNDAPFSLNLAPADTPGLYSWDSFLAQSKETDNCDTLQKSVANKNVAVIGGGSVAMDCAVTARHLGAARVYAISLESMEELPADFEEKMLAFAESVRFISSSRVTSIAHDDGAINAVHGCEIQWHTPGLFVPENAKDIQGSEFTIPVDIVVEAIGSGLSPETRSILVGLDNKHGRLAADPQTTATSHPLVFGGGDLTAPGKTVAACVNDGKKAAEQIAKVVPLSVPVIPPTEQRPSLKTNFCGLEFVNPFCLSSSPVGNTAEMIARAFDAGWGGAVYKTLNLEKDYEVIDPTPRLNALHNGNRRFIGLQNIEMISERPFAANLKDIAWLKKHHPDRMLIVSIMGYSDEGWIELAKGSENAGADMLELNFSCPQMAVEGAGHKVGQAYDMLERYTRVVKENVTIPVMAKMTPNITDMIPVALASKRGGADAISAINTLRAITEVDLNTFAPMPTIQGKGSISGYSGPAVKPIALRFVAELAQSKELSLPISGLGGLETWKDAAMFLLMGASNLQVTTAVMRYGYRIIESLCEGLEDYLESCQMNSIEQIIGKGLPNTVDPSEHHQTKHVVSKVDPDKCIGCGICHIACHDGANQAMKFDDKERLAEVDSDRCVGCLLCKHVCPVWDCISTEESDAPVIGGMHSTAINFISKP